MKYVNDVDRTIRGMLNPDGTDRLEGSPDGLTIQYKAGYRKGTGFILTVQFGKTEGGFFYFRMFQDKQLSFVLHPCARNTASGFKEAERILPAVLRDIACGDYMPRAEAIPAVSR